MIECKILPDNFSEREENILEAVGVTVEGNWRGENPGRRLCATRQKVN